MTILGKPLESSTLSCAGDSAPQLNLSDNNRTYYNKIRMPQSPESGNVSRRWERVNQPKHVKTGKQNI